MNDLPNVRIFISSPGDVNPEREVAKRVIDRLAREFSLHLRVEAMLWEREPLIATENFQTMITPPSESDITVVILWSRLGSFLPPENFSGAITGKKPVTGTEWEFEDAVHAYRQSGKPDLLLYRKQADIMGSLNDPEAVDLKLKQITLVREFLSYWFGNETTGPFKAASHLFTDAGQLEDMLAIHLRALLRQRLNLPEGEALKADIHWHEGSPFRGLQAFELKHAPIFSAEPKNDKNYATICKPRLGAAVPFYWFLVPAAAANPHW